MLKKVIISLPNRCNYNCVHCQIHKNHEAVDYSTLVPKKIQQINEIIELFGNNFVVNFMVGEPLLNLEILDIIKFCTENKIRTAMTTNGSLLNEITANKLLENGLSSLFISLDTLNEQKYLNLRSKNYSLSFVKKNIHSLKRMNKNQGKNLNIYISTIIFRENQEELNDLLMWVKRSELDGIVFQPVLPFHLFRPFYKKWVIGHDLTLDNLKAFLYKKGLLSVKKLYGLDLKFSKTLWPDIEDVEKNIRKIIILNQDCYLVKNPNDLLMKYMKFFSSPDRILSEMVCQCNNVLFLDEYNEFGHCPKFKMGPFSKENLIKYLKEQNNNELQSKIINCKEFCKIMNCFRDFEQTII